MKKLLFFFAMLMISTGAMAQSGVRGDANGDGEVGMPDVMFLMNYILGTPAENFNEKNADANLDGVISNPDAAYVVYYILYGKFPEGPVSDELVVSPDTVYVDADGQDFAFQLQTSAAYDYTPSATWLSYVSDIAGTDSLRFSAAMNPSTSQRTGYIAFASKDGGELKDTIWVVQYAKRDSRYININWERTSIESYNRETGRAVLVFQDPIPVMGDHDVTLLPGTETYEIRIIDDVQQLSDTKVQIDTREGKMGNLFKDQQFTLCSDPNYDPSESGGSSGGGTKPLSARSMVRGSGIDVCGPVYYPETIEVLRNGVPVGEVYNRARSATRDAQLTSEVTKEYNIFEYNYDNSGAVIWEKGAHNVSWQECKFDVGLKGIFAFDFGDVEWENVRFGDLKNFKAYLDGDFNTDLILKYTLTKGVEASVEKTLAKDIFSYRVKFMVGPVPVWINLSSDLMASVEAKAEAQVSVSGGVRAQAQFKGGVEWDANRGVNPISSFDYQYEVVKPEVEAEAHAEAKAYVWPQINIGIYDVLCPTINPKPYVRAYADARTAEANKPFFGWNAGVSTGVDLTLGLNLDLYFWKKEIGEIDPINLIDYDLVAVPTKIELEGDTISRVLKGTTRDVKYTVKGFNRITGSEYAIPGALVKIESLGGGEIDSEQWKGSDYFYSNLAGEVVVKYTQTDTIPGYLKATLITGDEERDKECRNWHSEVVDFRLNVNADDNEVFATRSGKAEVEYVLEEYTKQKEEENGVWRTAYGYKVGFEATGGKLDADTLITDDLGRVKINFDGGEGYGGGGTITASAKIEEFDTLFVQKVKVNKFTFDDPKLAKCYNMTANTFQFDGTVIPVSVPIIQHFKKDDSPYVVWSPPGYFSFIWEGEKMISGNDIRNVYWKHISKGAGGGHNIEAEMIFDITKPYDADFATQHPNTGDWYAPNGINWYSAYDRWMVDEEKFTEYVDTYYAANGVYPDEQPVPDFDKWTSESSTHLGKNYGDSSTTNRFATTVRGGSGKQYFFEEGNTYVFLMYRVQKNGDDVYLKLVINKSQIIDGGYAY